MIDFNVAVEQTDDEPLIRGGTGLKEWSAPETRSKLHTDNRIDCWTLGCVMFLLCTGYQPFTAKDKIEITPEFNLTDKLTDYSGSETFPAMVDLISKLMEVDPALRISAAEASKHPWLQ